MKKSLAFILTIVMAFAFTVSLSAMAEDYVPAVITMQPKSTAADPNSVAGFEILAENVITYQWYFIAASDDAKDESKYMELHDGDIVNGGFELKGTTENFLIVPSYDETHEAQFICKLVGYDGNVVWSEPVRLTVFGMDIKYPEEIVEIDDDTNTTEDDPVPNGVVNGEKDGCGSVVLGGASVMTVLAGAAVLSLRKKER